MSSDKKDMREIYFLAVCKVSYEMKADYINEVFREKFGLENFEWRDIEWSKENEL